MDNRHREFHLDLEDEDTVNASGVDGEDDDDDDTTDIRLAVVGLVFIVAGILFLLVPCIITDDPTLESRGYLISGGLMFLLGVVCIVFNIAWCRRAVLTLDKQQAERTERLQLKSRQRETDEQQQGSIPETLTAFSSLLHHQQRTRQETTGDNRFKSRQLPANGAIVVRAGNPRLANFPKTINANVRRDSSGNFSVRRYTDTVVTLNTSPGGAHTHASVCPNTYLNPTYVRDTAV